MAKTDEIHDLSDADWEYMQKKWGVTDREAARTIWLNVQGETDGKAQELFGDCENPPDDESEIIFDDDLTHEEKVSKLRAIREDKLTKDRIHARALGIVI